MTSTFAKVILEQEARGLFNKDSSSLLSSVLERGINWGIKLGGGAHYPGNREGGGYFKF